MGYNLTDFNTQVQTQEPFTLIDEASSVEFYIGVSTNSSDENNACWKIKKIYKVGNVWKSGFPDADQRFSFAWSQRLTYTYQ